MRVSENLSEEDKKLLPGMGIILEEGKSPHFQKKEVPLPPGKMRLSSGRIINRTPIEACLER